MGGYDIASGEAMTFTGESAYCLGKAVTDGVPARSASATVRRNPTPERPP